MFRLMRKIISVNVTLRENGSLMQKHWLSNVTKFSPKKVLILTKLTRFEFEKLKHPELSPSELEDALRKRGSDFQTLLYHHYIHKGCESRIENAFEDFEVKTRLVNRFEYTEENIDWADVVVTTGGDGTFLMAACKIPNNDKPVIGFNTDPTRSEGYLCLPKHYSINVKEAVENIVEGKFNWTFRKRIRTTLIGDEAFDPPIELHDQQLEHPEYRFFDCMQEQLPTTGDEEDLEFPRKTRVLPVLALNEVYFGECVSARVSYFEISKDDEARIKSKNAGLCVATGTGSTSWSYNISKISIQDLEEIAKLLNSEGTLKNRLDQQVIQRIANLYNKDLIFPAVSDKMLYTVRDPIGSYTLPYAQEMIPRGFVKKMEVRSRCFDACMVIDGGLSFSFNDGMVAFLEMNDSDALRTIVDFNCEPVLN